MALRDLDKNMTNINGSPIKSDGSEEVVATIRETVRMALATGPVKWEERAMAFMPDPTVTPGKKLLMFDLVFKLKDAGLVDLKSPEIELIKECVQHTMPFVYGQIVATLEAEVPTN